MVMTPRAGRMRQGSGARLRQTRIGTTRTAPDYRETSAERLDSRDPEVRATCAVDAAQVLVSVLRPGPTDDAKQLVAGGAWCRPRLRAERAKDRLDALLKHHVPVEHGGAVQETDAPHHHAEHLRVNKRCRRAGCQREQLVGARAMREV